MEAVLRYFALFCVFLWQRPDPGLGQVDPALAGGLVVAAVAALHLVGGEGQAVRPGVVDVQLQVDAALSERRGQKQGVLQRNRLVRAGVPQEGGRRVRANLKLQGHEASKLRIPGVRPQKAVDGALVRVLAGGDHRVAEQQAVRADFVGREAQRALAELLVIECAQAAGQVSACGEAGGDDPFGVYLPLLAVGADQVHGHG